MNLKEKGPPSDGPFFVPDKAGQAPLLKKR
jgi:hypothetical protein